MTIDPRVNRDNAKVVGTDDQGCEISIHLCLDGIGYWTVETWAKSKFGTDRSHNSPWRIKSDQTNAEKLARREANRRWVYLNAKHVTYRDLPLRERLDAAQAAHDAWVAANPE